MAQAFTAPPILPTKYGGSFGYQAPASILPEVPALPTTQAPALGASSFGAPNPFAATEAAPGSMSKTTAPSFTGPASAAYAGAQAGAPAANAYDTKSGVISTLAAGATGAAAGAVVGGPVGAVVGGGIGLVTGGLNAWLSVSGKNKAKKEQKALLREAEQKQQLRDSVARSDALEEQGYQRGEAERQQQWAKNLQIQKTIKDLIADGTLSRDRYVKTGRI